MLLPWTLIFAFLAHHSVLASTPAKRFYNTHNYYVLEHNPHTASGASLVDVARELGVEIVEQAGELRDHWLVRTEKPITEIAARGEPTDRVLETYHSLRSRAASTSLKRSADAEKARRVVSSVNYLARQTLRQRVKRAPPPVRPPPDSLSRTVALRLGIKDPMFDQQWHLVNNEFPEHMMNATPVWDLGVTGKGVISALVDDGLDYTSEDLKANFDADDSYDFNDHDPLPTPKLFDDHHGTRCAGQIAAGKNNACGLGIAYESKVAGIRILSGPISDVDEAAALNYGFQNTSIYSCSWGPPDNGKSMEGPGYLIKKAVVNGINNGRGGKGSIFVFASGNGAAHGDQCNFDGYTNSIYSVTVSAVDYKGLHPYYSEPCAANMIVAYSSGGTHHIVTTDKGKNECATTHGGTSAAAPNAVGVFALALEVRSDLTWRDIQHLCVRTARIINADDPDWEPTAAGRPYSYKFGFGVLDASRYIEAVRDWELVKPQAWFQTETIQLNGGEMDTQYEMSGGVFIVPGGVTSTISITQDMLESNNFEALEHINVRVWIAHGKRGDVEVEIVSPNGITSMLAAKRNADTDISGYPGWTFMSVKHWGENPIGDWTIRVSDQANGVANGTFLGWNMIFWGSTIDASQAKQFELAPNDDEVFPPPVVAPSPTAPVATTTKQHPKPTVPPEPAASTTAAVDDAVIPTTSSVPAIDEGLFAEMSNLLSNQKWFFGAIGVVLLFGIGTGIFFWRRRAARLRENYALIHGSDELSMSALRSGRPTTVGGAPRTKELYDAFGEVSDDEDDDDANEQTMLRGHAQDQSIGGLGFHSGFLDDDEPPSAPTYKDEPDPHRHSEIEVERHSPDHEHSTASASSGDGSWEHASQQMK